MASIIVANLTTTSAYVASFIVEAYTDVGLTTVIASASCGAVSDGSGGHVQAGPIVISGLSYGDTYYLRAGVVAPVTGLTSWSATHTVVAGSNTAPSGTTYAETLTPGISGIVVSVTPSSIPTDIQDFESVWTVDGSTPPPEISPAWSGNVDGSGNLHFFAGSAPSQTVHVFIRAVNTGGQTQSWTSLGSATALATASAGLVSTAGFVIDGSGSTPSTGSKGLLQVPFAGTITGWTLLGDVSGSASITVKKSTFAGFPSTTSIVASAPPTLSSQQNATSTTLTGWTTAVAAGDVLEFVLASATTVTRLLLELQITRS